MRLRSLSLLLPIALGLSACASTSTPSTMGTTATLETSMGNIVIQFYPDKAPKHVASFLDLARRGVYDGTLFHRVIPGFMIQGGDPLTKDPKTPRTMMGTGNATTADGKELRLPAEFNDVSHVRGIVSMARSSDPNSASAQFFIVVKDSTFLDRQYTVFGRVVEGMDVADKIVAVARDERDNPKEPVTIKKITITEAK